MVHSNIANISISKNSHNSCIKGTVMIVCTLKQNENVGIKLQGFKKGQLRIANCKDQHAGGG